MRLLIGCPVFDRAWILPDWFDAITRQDFPLSDIGFVFIVSPSDIETIAELMKFAEAHPEVQTFDVVENVSQVHDTHPEGHRIWTSQKYQKMANLRNELLSQVVCHDPEHFFSLDSDIILEDPSTLRQLFNLNVMYEAISPLMFMTPEGTEFPSTMSWGDSPGGTAIRPLDTYPLGTIFQTDIIMAAKMMSREVYQNVRYTFHKQGEDLSWSLNATQAGFKLYLASSIYCPHIMSRAQLTHYSEHGDPRKEISCRYLPLNILK